MRAQPQLFVRRYEDANDPTAWILLDLYDTDPIKMNLRVQDVMEPSIAAASYSQTFRIPHSTSNGVFFQQAFNVNQTLFDPAKKVQAYINNEGQLWMMGVVQLMNVFREDATGMIEYEIAFISEVSDFATQIGLSVGGETGASQGGFLTDLDLSDYNHQLNYNNIIISWARQLGGAGGEPGDIVYPLVEWGYNYTGSGNATFPTIPTLSTTGASGATGSKPFTNSNFPLLQGQLKPALRIKALWDKIFERTEYTYESEFIQGNDYVSPSGVTGSRYGNEFKDLYVISEKYARATLYETGQTGGTGPIQTIGTKLVSNYFYAIPDSAIPDNNRIYYLNTIYDLGSNFNNTSQVYTITVPGQYTFEFTGSYQFEPGFPLPSGSEYFVFALKTDGGYTTFDYGIDNFAAGNYYGDITATVTYTFAAGDTFQFYGSIVGNPNIGAAYFTSLQITTIGTPAGDTLDIKAILPDNIKQIDFIKSVVERFKLVFEPSKTKPKHFIITPWKDWIKQGTVKDWTTKLNDKKSYKLTPLFQSQPRFMTFKDQEDSDYINFNYQQARKQVYGQLNQDSQIEIIKGSKDIQGIFAPLQIAPIGYGAGAGTGDVQAAETFLIPHIAKDTASNDGPGKREPIQPKLRLAWYNGLVGQTGPGSTVSKTWYLKDDSGTAQVQYQAPLMSAYYPHPWSSQNYLLDWSVSTPTWDAGITGNPSGVTNLTTFQRFWSDWYNATYGQLTNVTLPNGQTIQARDYAYIFEGEFILDYKDIIDLRFNDLIWIKDAYYLVNTIEDYVVGQKTPCKVVLYKINNIGFSIPSPNLPVDNICYSAETLCDAVCCQFVSPISVIFVADPNDITVGTRFYLNSAGSIFAPAGFYSDGTYVYTVDVNSQVTTITTIGVSPAICNCIPDLDPKELCYIGATGDACLACCCQGPTGEFWMEDATATWTQNAIIYSNSTGSAVPANGWYAYNNSDFVYLNNGLVTQSGTCSNCNCLIYDLTQYVGCTGSTLCNAVCCTNNLNYTFWADSDNLNTATFLFSDQSGTPVPNGWYFNGLAAVQVAGGSGAVAATGSPASCQPCGNETLDVYFDFLSNVNGTGSFVISKSFNGVSFMPESVKDLSTIPANTTFNYTGAVATGTFVRGTLVYGSAHDTGVFSTKIEGGATINSQNTVRFSTYTYTPANATTGGNEYRFSVNLTGTIYDCSLTGGTAWKCTPPSCNITGGNSVYVYDTNTEVCCDPLYIYGGGYSRIDNNTEVFVNGNCTGATGTCFECNDFVGDSYSGNEYHQYDPVQICNGLTTSTIEFYWYSIDRPNRFNLYDNSGLVATSGWVGFANYPGPWGSSLSTPSSGTIGALYTSDMYLLVEAGPADPFSPISDTWNGNFVCSTSCFQYLNEMGFNWIGDYQDCNGTWYYGATITPGSSVCAIAGSIFNISGTLTQTYSCIS